MSLHSERRLKVFAFDPSTAAAYENRAVGHLEIAIPWEMDPIDEDMAFVGPRGEYLEVIDYDPASGVFYDPVDLNNAQTLRTGGLEPTADDPRFHQQMVYAVAMQTISIFEDALGRVALWAPREWDEVGDVKDNFGFVQRLRIYPHALREANAYYDPKRKALLFGYFQASHNNPQMLPGATVFTCLSHDIIVHETCHALLDGLHPYFAEPSNPDVHGLHEGFSDIVAILQHFSHPSILEDQIGRTRGDLETESRLGQLAQEFGVALGRGAALRDALGKVVNGVWQLNPPNNRALDDARGPHQRGSILVAAIFRSFLSIYKGRTADLLRIATGGRGILPDGELDPDLRRRLAREAAKSAKHLLTMCIRALDYCPPVDVTFGDYLRAIVTADRDLYPEDEQDYRKAIIEAFTAWGIAPEGMHVVTENTLTWPTAVELAKDRQAEPAANMQAELAVNAQAELAVNAQAELKGFEKQFASIMKLPNAKKGVFQKIGKMIWPEQNKYGAILELVDHLVDLVNDRLRNRDGLQRGLHADRETEHRERILYARLFWITLHKQNSKLLDLIGLTLDQSAPRSINRSDQTERPAIQVHSVRMSQRTGNRGQKEYEYVVELVQTRAGYFNPNVQQACDQGKSVPDRDFSMRSGVTLLIDARSYEIRRVIRSRGAIDSDVTLERQRAFRRGERRVSRSAFADRPEPKPENIFAALHRDIDRGRDEWPE